MRINELRLTNSIRLIFTDFFKRKIFRCRLVCIKKKFFFMKFTKECVKKNHNVMELAGKIIKKKKI